MNKRPRFKLYRDKDKPDKFKICLRLEHERFSVYFESPERFTRAEANARIIYLAASLDADTDGIVVAE